MTANNYGLKFARASSHRGTANTNANNNATVKNISTFTLEGWIKVGSGNTWNHRFYCERQGSGKLPRLAGAAWNDPTTGKGWLRFEAARVDGTADTNYNYNTGAPWDDYWHHVAFTCDYGANGKYQIYFDGAKVAEGNVVGAGVDGSSNPLKVSNTNPLGLFVGAFYDGTTYQYWDGKLDNFRLWSNIQSQSSLLANMNDHLATPGTATGLIEEWRFNEGSGTSTVGAKNATWAFTLTSSGIWNADRPWLGDGTPDSTPPTNNTMNAPTSITDSGFTLNWTSTTDDVYVQYYEVTVATDNAFSNTVAGYAAKNCGLSTSLAVTGLNPSTNYYARVRALDAALNGSAYRTYNSNAAITTSAASGDTTVPTAPVATAASSINYSQFTANWNVATDNVGVTGYKLDVALDSSFVSFVSGYRNIDVGNVLTYVVSTGIDASTTYYYRVRAYDAAENESVDSNTVTLTTSAAPDTVKPDIVVATPATSVASSSFTANWNVGVDNVGVTGYRLDVAYDDVFTSYVPGYQNLNVSNVLSYAVTGLEPQTGYYYRVRAYDAAGNVSNDTDSPEQIATTASTLDEGGVLIVNVDPVADAYTDSANPTTNYNVSPMISVGNGSVTSKFIWFKFDLSEFSGSIVNANLNLYVSNATNAASITIERGTSTAWTETGLTYNTQPGFSGSTVISSTWTATGWKSVDIASLINAGFTTYSFNVRIAATDDLQIDSREGTNIPYLTLEIDPTATTEVQTMTATPVNTNVTNLLKNPSAEIGGTAFGGSTGITLMTSATLLQDAAFAYHGTYSCKVVTAASSGSGVKFESNTGLAIAGTGQTFKAACAIRAGASVTIVGKLRLVYTDATTTDGTLVNIYINTDWRNFEFSAVATNGKTVDKVELWVYTSAASALTYWVDAATVCASSLIGTLFHWDGTSSVNTDWDGTAHASTSTYASNTLSVLATYLGDSNQNNSVVVAYKRTLSPDWVVPNSLTATFNRSTKQVTATVGPTYTGNYLFNPSFTTNTSQWTANGSGATITRITTDAVEDIDDSTYACAEISVNGSGASHGAFVSHLVPAAQGQKWTLSVYAKSVSGATTINLIVEEKSTVGGALASQSYAMALTTSWQRFSNTFTLGNASTAFIVFSVYNPAASAAVWRIDRAQLEKHDTVNPYIDGDLDDGQWEGTPYLSRSYRTLAHEVQYDVRYTFSDADGITGFNPASATAITQAAPDDVLTIEALTFTPQNTAIDVVCSYTGDDNQGATAIMEWKRSDLANYSKATFSWDRSKRWLLSTITNLKPNTSYDVKVTFTDVDDGVNGGTYISGTSAYIQQTVLTTAAGTSTEATTPKITFGGFVLQGEDNGFGVVDHDSLSLPERRTEVQDLPRMDGAVELSDWWGKRVIQMKGFVYADTRANLSERVRDLRQALAPRLQRLVIDTVDAQGYYFNATCTSLGVSETAGETIYHLLWDAEFTCADPFRYDTQETVERTVTLNPGETFTLSNDGDLSCDPYFLCQFSSNSATFSLVNETTGERIQPDTTFSTTDKLVIDSARMVVRKNGVEVDYVGGFPRLAVGQNTIRVDMSSGKTIITSRRRHRYL